MSITREPSDESDFRPHVPLRCALALYAVILVLIIAMAATVVETVLYAERGDCVRLAASFDVAGDCAQARAVRQRDKVCPFDCHTSGRDAR